MRMPILMTYRLFPCLGDRSSFLDGLIGVLVTVKWVFTLSDATCDVGRMREGWVFKAIFLCVIFVCATNGRNLESRRVRRQNADVKATEYFARLALERMPTDCLQIGCGLVDLQESGKKKRTDTQNSKAVILLIATF
uniref:Uncharacterized protein n=1 Tax=Magallana gigas TaxID=29159 RepID=A0A8W8N4E2_MAGGI